MTGLSGGLGDVVAEAGREARPRIVAALIRVTGDWALAEDCAQEALAAALERWPRDGVPGNPGGWLMTVARNRMIDTLRRASVEARKYREMPDVEPQPDDQLKLIFTCCHPALSLEARLALTLRVVAGLPTADIARVFLVTEAAMTRRITRAKQKIADSGIPYRVPSGAALADRLPDVLLVLYLVFTRGYDPDGTPHLAAEAIRLTRLLRVLMPAEPEVGALLALFLLQDSRRAARHDENGNLVPLDVQDRSRWDSAAITEGVKLLGGTRSAGSGPYEIQARIAACHALAPSFADTDWPAIARLYDRLHALQPTPVVALNRAVAHGYAYTPEAGLTLLAEAGDVPRSAALAVEADLRSRAGDHVRAAALFAEAAAAAPSDVERRALLNRALLSRALLSRARRPT